MVAHAAGREHYWLRGNGGVSRINAIYQARIKNGATVADCCRHDGHLQRIHQDRVLPNASVGRVAIMPIGPMDTFEAGKLTTTLLPRGNSCALSQVETHSQLHDLINAGSDSIGNEVGVA